MGVGCPCPPVDDNIETPRHLFFIRRFVFSLCWCIQFRIAICRFNLFCSLLLIYLSLFLSVSHSSKLLTHHPVAFCCSPRNNIFSFPPLIRWQSLGMSCHNRRHRKRFCRLHLCTVQSHALRDQQVFIVRWNPTLVAPLFKGYSHLRDNTFTSLIFESFLLSKKF